MASADPATKPAKRKETTVRIAKHLAGAVFALATLYSVSQANAQLSPSSQPQAAEVSQSQQTQPAAMLPKACLGSQNITGDYEFFAGDLCIDGSLTATGNISIQAGVSSTVTITGTVKSTGGGSISIEGGAVATGAISTTNNNISVLAGLFGTGTPNLTTGAITTTNGSVSVSADGVSTPITTGTITTTNDFISVAGSAAVQTAALKTSASYITVGGGSVDVTGAINTTGGGTTPGNILIGSDTTIKTSTITTSLGGVIDLEENETSLFTIGTSGTNGVGKLTTTGSGDDPLLASALVYVKNAGGGGIKLAATTDISVAGATSTDKAGSIILNAGSGTITIPAGTMSVTSTGGAGQITLLGNQISATGAVILNASQLPAVVATNHQVKITPPPIS